MESQLEGGQLFAGRGDGGQTFSTGGEEEGRQLRTPPEDWGRGVGATLRDGGHSLTAARELTHYGV